MNKEKYKITKYYIVLILLLFSLFLGLIYCLNNDILKQDSLMEETTENTTAAKVDDNQQESQMAEELDVDEQLVLDLQAMINVFDTYKAGSYYGYFYSEDYIDFNTMSDDVKIAIGISQNSDFRNDFLDSIYEATTPDNTTLDMIILSKEEVDDGINAFFGPNTSVIDTNLKDYNYDYCGFSRFAYDETRQVYMQEKITCNAFPIPYIDTKIISAIDYGKTIELTIKVAFIKYEVKDDNNIIKYIYKSNTSTKEIEKHELLTDNSYSIDNILDKLNSFKFTFTLGSDNYYYFTKVEKISS